MKTFFEMFLDHEVDAKDISKFVKNWHEDASARGKSVFDYLGMTEKNYATFMMSPEKAETLRNLKA